MDRLKDKRALITHGTSPIGLATARRFVDEGALVMLTGTSSDLVDQARHGLDERGTAWCLDAGVISDQQFLAQRVKDFAGGIDVLFVNANAVRIAPMETWDEAAFDHEITSNLKAPFFLVKTLLPLLARPSSVVINTTACAAAGLRRAAVFEAGRAALIALARGLAVELSDKGIRVNLVSPGPLELPPALRDRAHEAASAAMRQRLPARRLGEPVEVADAVVYLASDESSFTIGTELVVDGGLGAL